MTPGHFMQRVAAVARRLAAGHRKGFPASLPTRVPLMVRVWLQAVVCQQALRPPRVGACHQRHTCCVLAVAAALRELTFRQR